MHYLRRIDADDMRVGVSSMASLESQVRRCQEARYLEQKDATQRHILIITHVELKEEVRGTERRTSIVAFIKFAA